MMTMTISKKHTLVLLAALIIAAGSTFFLLVIKPAPKEGIYYNVFKTEHGWGYDVLVNKNIIVHQPFEPGKPGGNGFSTKEAAGADAQTVIEKIKSTTKPAIGQKEEQRPAVSPAQ